MVPHVSPAIEPHTPPHTPNSAFAPLREPLFRILWIAAVISYIGTWMQRIGAAWLMTQLTTSPLLVGLVQGSAGLPAFLFMLPAGALADMMDRRKLLLYTQWWMVFAALGLGILTVMHLTTPWLLIFFTFLLGIGAVLNDPAWQAVTPEVARPEQHAAAVALNSAAFNVARAVGPAFAGVVVATSGSGAAFLINAASFFGVILFLYRWKRPRMPRAVSVNLPGDMMSSIAAGIRHASSSRHVKSVLIRSVAFSSCGVAYLSLLPLVCQPYKATGFGLLWAFFGIGALSGAVALSHLRKHFSIDTVVAAAIGLFALMTAALGRAPNFAALGAVTFLAGMAWIVILASLNVTAQTMCPPAMRARAISLYLLVLQGGMALGATVWGAIASRIGISTALLAAALALVLGLALVPRHRLVADSTLTPGTMPAD